MSARRRDLLVAPRISQSILRWFTWYARRHICRHFHALRVSRSVRVGNLQEGPTVLFLNHASWWDPLVCLALKHHFFPWWKAYAPIDAEMLSKYALLRKVGFFGVERKSLSGGAHFLRTAETVLRAPMGLLVLTPQARFADVRERPLAFGCGLGHLARRVPEATFVPLAMEYVFWEERFPEILVRFGEPIHFQPEHVKLFGPEDFTRLFESKLSEAQDALAEQAQRRCAAEFDVLLSGRAGAAAVYDLWREFKAVLGGRHFRKGHGTL